MSLAIRLAVEPVRSLVAASVIAGYTAVGTAMVHPIRQLVIQNLTDQAVMFSFDGINDHLPLASNSAFTDDITANKTVDQGFYLPHGTIIYVKRIGTPTTGSVYITAFYGTPV